MSNNSNKRSLFWTSYSDLMTTLFFTMLVLFVVIIVALGQSRAQLQKELNRIKADSEMVHKIERLNKQFETLDKSEYLKYDPKKCIFYSPRFEGKEIFEPDKDVILKKYDTDVENVGHEIKKLIDDLYRENTNFKFQLVIEGTAAMPIHYSNTDNKHAYELSYKRALALYNRWKNLGIRGENTEIIIAGSGFNGINRDTKNEDNNKRFIIQIIPKIERPK